MTRFDAFDTVDPGIYLNLRRLKFVSMEDEGVLPGTAGDTYHRVPAIAMLVVGPLLGLAYFMFLPLLGFAMLATLIGRKAAATAREVARAGARSLRPAWQPARAYLANSKESPDPTRPDRWSEEAAEDLETEPTEQWTSELPTAHLSRSIVIHSPLEEVYSTARSPELRSHWYVRYSSPRKVGAASYSGPTKVLVGRDFPLEQDVLEEQIGTDEAHWRTHADHPAEGTRLGSNGILVNLPCDEVWTYTSHGDDTEVRVEVDLPAPDLELPTPVAGTLLLELEEECLEHSLEQLKELCE